MNLRGSLSDFSRRVAPGRSVGIRQLPLGDTALALGSRAAHLGSFWGCFLGKLLGISGIAFGLAFAAFTLGKLWESFGVVGQLLGEPDFFGEAFSRPTAQGFQFQGFPPFQTRKKKSRHSLSLPVTSERVVAREFYLKNPTPPGAAHAT